MHWKDWLSSFSCNEAKLELIISRYIVLWFGLVLESSVISQTSVINLSTTATLHYLHRFEPIYCWDVINTEIQDCLSIFGINSFGVKSSHLTNEACGCPLRKFNRYSPIMLSCWDNLTSFCLTVCLFDNAGLFCSLAW